MINKEKITISIDSNLLYKIDEKVDKLNFKNRSSVIENFIREWLKLKEDISAIIIANDDNWNDDDFILDVPKILIEIDWKTLLEKHLDMLKKSNIENVVIAIWDKKEMVIDFLKRKKFPLNIEVIEFNKNDKTWIVFQESRKFFISNKYIVILWDNYHHDFNMLDFIYYHNTSGVDLSIVVKPIDVSNWYWNIKLEWNNIVRFVEKPKNKDDISFIINAWIYIFNSNIVLNDKLNNKLETDFFPDYVLKNKTKAYFHNWKWFHMQDTKTLNLFN